MFHICILWVRDICSALKPSHFELWRGYLDFAGYLEANGSRPHKDDTLRAFACVIDYVFFFDENTTVNGVVLIADMGRYTLKFETYLPLEDRKNFIETWQVRVDIEMFILRLVTFNYVGQEINEKIETVDKNVKSVGLLLIIVIG